MKQLYTLCLIFLLGMGSLKAQEKSGHIIYDQVVHIEIDMSKIPVEAQQWVKDMPKEIKMARQLLFTESEALYTNYEDPDAAPAEEGGMATMMRRNMPEDYTYVNIEESRYVDKKDFFGRLFLIKDSVMTLDWKITGEQEEIAGFPCMKATAVNPADSLDMVAWFTPSIPVPAGPGTNGQLPGMILKMEMSGKGMGRGPGSGTVVLTARTVEFRKVKKNEIEEPDKGKVVTQDEFREIVREKIKEMRENGSFRGGPGMRMAH